MAVFNNLLNNITEKVKDQVEASTYYSVNTQTEPLNCRKGPSTNDAILGTFAKGSKVVLIQKTNSEWYLVQQGDLKGYAAVKYLKEV